MTSYSFIICSNVNNTYRGDVKCEKRTIKTNFVKTSNIYFKTVSNTKLAVRFAILSLSLVMLT